MSIVGVVWGWVLLSCPIVFIAGLVWISRARHLNEPIDGVPSMTRWILVSAGSLGLLVLIGGVALLAGLGGDGSALIAWIVFPVIIIGPIYYFVSAMKWISKVSGGLKAQRSGSANRL